ncbi:unnamed protein product, partial [Mesorhabditis belari]|uniref:Uncharacterized protein n=1 Tax=Mesorhabditis belari TaxID=2138241 RepID=A0AAF3J2M5_9BILA
MTAHPRHHSIVTLTNPSTYSHFETKLALKSQEGAMLASSSSKDDDDLLSTSSDEIEQVARETLKHLDENEKSIASVKSNGTIDTIDREKQAAKEADLEKEADKKGDRDQADPSLMPIIRSQIPFS